MKIIIAFLSLSFLAFSQPWMEGLSEEESKNFYSIQESFYEYMSDKDINQKGTGYKQFKRWEWFWESRVLEDGSFPTEENINRVKQQLKKKNPFKLNSANEWKTIGPDDSPGGYEGLGRINVVKAEPGNNNRLWAGAASGGLWFSPDAGTTWECKSDNVSVFDVLGVSDIEFDPNNIDIMYVASGDRDAANTYSSGLLKSTDGGETWNDTGLNYDVKSTRIRLNKILINPNDTDSIYVGGSNGIWLSTDAGDNWTRLRSGYHVLDMEMKPNDPKTIYASSFSHVILRTTNAGETWEELSHNNLPNSGIQRTAIAVTDDDPEYLVALMSANHSGLHGVYRSNDGGDSWVEIAGSNPNMLHWSQNTDDQGGQGWFDLCIAIDPTDKNKIFIGGINIWQTNNGGNDWEISTMWYGGTQNPTVHADQHDLWFTPDGSRLLVGNDGGVYKTDDNGANYDWIGRGKNTTQFYRIATSQQNLDVLIGGSQDNGTKLRLTEWDHVLGGDGMECLIYKDDDNIVMGASQNGNIFKSINGGNNFRRINSSGGGNYDDIDETGAWVTPYAISPTDTSKMLVGMDDMWYSSNGGDVFTEVATGQNSKWRFIEYSPANSNVVFAATNSQFWYSPDGGQSWVQRARPGNQVITSIEPHPTDPDIVYATNGNWNANNKVFESTDRGQSWSNITSGLPNLPANCVFYQEDSDNRIYVGTDIGLYYRDDNSNGWQELNDGLPNTIVTDIEMNYANQRLYAGTYGRGVWYYDISPTLDTPELVSIADNSTQQELDNLVLDWNDVPNATEYTLQVAKSANFSNPIINFDDISNSRYTLNNLTDFTDYFWRVKATNSFAESEWSFIRTFRTKMIAAELESPSDESIARPLTFLLDWNDVNGAEEYQLEIATDISFSDILIDKVINDSEYQILAADGLDHFQDYFWRVKARRSDEEAIWSSTFEFQTIIGKVQLDAPISNTINAELQGTLSWSALNGADNYDIEISTLEDFSTVQIAETGISELELDYDLDFDSKYFWRVRGSYIGGKGEWSDANNFQTILQPLDLNPTASRYSNPIDLLLSWDPVGTQDSYTLQVSEDAQFSGGDMIIATLDGTSNETEVELNFNTNYFARIRRNVDTRTSAWSDFIEFTTKLNIVNLQSPPNEQADFTNQDKFVWNEVIDAENYQFQVSTLEDFSSNLIYDTEVSDTEFAPSGLNAGVTLYWRVRAVSFDGKNFGDWSETRSVITKAGTPNLTNPNNNSIFEANNVLLEWEDFDNAISYTLQVSNDQSFQNTLNNEELTATEYSLSQLDAGEYFWRIKAKTNNQETDWSAVWKFTIAAPIPDGPELSLPENNSVDIDYSTINFSWRSNPEADTYNLEIADSESFDNIIYEENGIENSSHSVSGVFAANQKYFWRVYSANVYGTSDPSVVWNFTTAADDGKWGLVFPPNNSKGIEYKETEFLWNKYSENSIYEFTISDEEDGDILLSLPEYSDTTYSTELQADTRYCWKVIAVDTEDNSTEEMEWCFTTKKPASVLGTKDGNLFKLYPNPADNVIHLESKNAELINSYIIFDINGNEILRAENLNSHELQINTQKLNTGKYLIRFDTNSGNYQMNFTISK